MKRTDKIKLTICFIIITMLIGITAFSDTITNQMLTDNSQIISANLNIDKPKKDYMDITLNLCGKSLHLGSDLLTESDILKVALSGGQTIKGTIDTLKDNGYTIEECFNKLYLNFNDVITDFLSQSETKPTNSQITFHPDKSPIFEYTKESDGNMVNKKQMYENIYFLLGTGKQTLDLELEKTSPEHTILSNKMITKEVSHFITDLSGSKKNRHHNVTTALNKINGKIIESGQVVSFNELSSPHDASGGYTLATIISNGSYVDGMGGGICQASTTLYNAVLLAGLEVKSVNKHSIPVQYVKLGFDSMVSSYSDMVFENTSKYPIYIRAFTDSESAYVYLYGKTMEDNQKIVRRNEIVKTISAPETITIIDDTKKYYPKVEYTDQSFELKYARKGYEVNSYLDYYKDNKLVETKKIRHEIYPPQAQVIVIGAKERNTEKTELSEPNEEEKITDNSVKFVKNE